MNPPAIPMPGGEDPDDLASALAALEKKRSGPTQSTPGRPGRAQGRAILMVVLVGLLIGGAVDLFASTSQSQRQAAAESRASVVFSNAESGTCLSWPANAPEKPSFVRCRDPHMFEVAKPVGMDTLAESCQRTVHEYLGARFDPNSKFTIKLLRASEVGGTEAGNRNLLCGLQLLGVGGQPVPFSGRIAELDQSKIWPIGTCLGIDASNLSTDVPVDCATLHALEVVGAVNLADRFPDTLPSDSDQRAFIEEACTRAADVYLAPGNLATARLSLGYRTVSAASWNAGSKQVSCDIGRPGQPGWIAWVGDARAQSTPDVPRSREPAPSASEGPPPPVYDEPLIPLGPIPTAPPPGPADTATNSAPPTTTVPAEVAPGLPPGTGPLPGPETPPGEGTGPQPGIVEIPGLAPITLPGYVPPPPPAPPA